MNFITVYKNTKVVFTTILFLLSIVFTVTAQQPGMRGYTFDAERYKVDMEMIKMRNQKIEPYTPTNPQFYSEKSDKTVKIPYKAPKFPNDTLVVFIDDFVTRLETSIHGADDYTAADEKLKNSTQKELLLTGNLKYKKSNYYTLAYLYNDLYDKEKMEKYNFHANKRTTVWLQKTGGSDKTFLKLNATIEKAVQSDDYQFQINNNGEVNILFIKNGAKEGIIFKTKTDAWKKDQLNEVSVLKLGEVLNFICNGQLVHSIILEHPWTRMFTSLHVDYGVELSLKNYMHVFYPI